MTSIKCFHIYYRCVQSKAYNNLICYNDEDDTASSEQSEEATRVGDKSDRREKCDIDMLNRKNCRACRWSRCIKAGLYIYNLFINMIMKKRIRPKLGLPLPPQKFFFAFLHHSEGILPTHPPSPPV